MEHRESTRGGDLGLWEPGPRDVTGETFPECGSKAGNKDDN